MPNTATKNINENFNISTLPNILIPATSGKLIKKEHFIGKKIILFFYPKDNSPGCTIEVQDFSANFELFKNAGYDVYGISRDNIDSHTTFKAKQSLAFDLISDSDQVLCHFFDVIKPKSMFGKTIESLERSTFIIDENGYIEKKWLKVEVKGHVQTLLEFLKLNTKKKTA